MNNGTIKEGVSIKKLILIVTSLCLLLGLACAAGAEDKTTYQRAAAFDIVLLEDGSASIEERWEVDFRGEGEFSRYGRIYLPSERYALRDVRVAVDGVDCTMLDAPDVDRPDGYAAVYADERGTVVEIYHRSANQSRAFKIGYTVTDAVILHDDTAEFGWNLTSGDEVSYIGQVQANVRIPYSEGTTQADWQIWAHGPLNGYMEKTDVNRALLEVREAKNTEPVDIRLAMPREAFTGGYLEAGSAMRKILAQEERLRVQAGFRRSGGAIWLASTLVIGALCILLGRWVLRLQSVGRGGYATGGERVRSPWRYDAAGEPEYRIALPDGRSPAFVGLLCHFYDHDDVSGQILTATLMDLSLRGHVKIDNDAENAYITLTAEAEEPSLQPHERALLQLLREAMQGQPRVAMRAITDFIDANPKEAHARLDAFFAPVQEELSQVSEPTAILQRGAAVGALMAALALLLCLGVMAFTSVLMAATMVVLPIAVFILAGHKGAPGVRLTREGEDILAGWSAFSRFLDAFVLGRQEAPELDCWRRYVVYAVALGKEKSLLEALPLRYPQIQAQTDDSYFGALYGNPLYMHTMSGAFDDFGRSMHGAATWRDPSQSAGSGDGGFSASAGGSGSGSGGSFSD